MTARDNRQQQRTEGRRRTTKQWRRLTLLEEDERLLILGLMLIHTSERELRRQVILLLHHNRLIALLCTLPVLRVLMARGDLHPDRDPIGRLVLGHILVDVGRLVPQLVLKVRVGDGAKELGELCDVLPGDDLEVPAGLLELLEAHPCDSEADPQPHIELVDGGLLEIARSGLPPGPPLPRLVPLSIILKCVPPLFSLAPLDPAGTLLDDVDALLEPLLLREEVGERLEVLVTKDPGVRCWVLGLSVL